MPDKAAIGAGSIFKIGDGATPTEAFTAVGKVIRIDAITQTNPLVDATTLDSTAKEFLGGLAEGDEFGLEAQLRMDDATHGETSGMDKAFLDKTARNFELVPNGQSKKLKFAAIVTQRAYGPYEVEGVMRHNWRLKLSGPITLAAVT